jgi:hypothetical protein
LTISAGPSTAASSSASSSSTTNFPESTIAELTGMGFERDKVIAELRNFNGDKTKAMAALFAKSLKF